VKIYADTSVLIAWFHPADDFAPTVVPWCRSRQIEFCWNSILRLEVRHSLRRLKGTYATTAWRAYRASETAGLLRIDPEPLAVLFDWGDELSARHAQKSGAGTWDFLHVAIAAHLEAEVFLTCDVAQADLARTAISIPVHVFH